MTDANMYTPYQQARSDGGMAMLGAMIVAAGAGYVAGILLAPRSGRETRDKIKHKAELARSKAQLRMAEAKARMRDMVEAARRRAQEAHEQSQAKAQEKSS